MERLDVFAHVLPRDFYQRMLEINPAIPEALPFVKHPLLQDTALVSKYWDGKTRQVISCVNINPEDYVAPEKALELCEFGNNEMLNLVEAYPEIFDSAVAMLPMNNIYGALDIINTQVSEREKLVGVQVFTRHLGLSIADESFEKIFALCNDKDIPMWLHPVFDRRKPDNNMVFSWEYELSQAMLEIVEAKYLKKYPKLKIIVHHAGAMIPYFAGRIEHILAKDLAEDFRKFYVDTALLGNAKALELAIDYFGVNHVLFGTDAPLGIPPAGATKEIIEAIESLNLGKEDENRIFFGNAKRIIKGRE